MTFYHSSASGSPSASSISGVSGDFGEPVVSPDRQDTADPLPDASATLPKERAHEAGFFLVEGIGSMLFYLLMLGIGAGIVMALYANRELSQAQQGLSQLRMEIRQLFSASPNYNGLTTTVARNAGIIPMDMDTGSGVLNPWNGAVTIATGADTSTFTISYAGVPQESCTKMAMYQHGSWINVTVGGTSINQATGTVANAASACGATNTVVFTSN